MSAQARVPHPRGSGDLLRVELLSAARQFLLVPKHGAPFSLRALARTVGVSPTAVYRHFDSAEDLVATVIDDQHTLLRAAVGVPGGSVNEAAFTQVGLRYVQWGLANPGAYQLLFESAERYGLSIGPGSPGFALLEDVSQWLRLGGQEPATELATRAWISLHGLTSLRVHKPSLPWSTPVEHEVEAIARTILDPGRR